MSTVRLRHALRADLPTIVDIWVDAFTDDPYLRWIQPDDEAWPAFGTAWLTFIAELCFEHGHTYLADPAHVAVAWIPPDHAFATADDVARGSGIIAEHAGETRAEDAFTTIVSARQHLLEEPHWTLQYVGVRRARQSTGLGVAAIAPGLARCDNDRLPCSLVSTNARNVPFYERLGFTVAVEVSTPDGAATLRPMHRRAPAQFTD
jgi:GNAT superfamily N-acetyltransferase